MKWVEKGAYNSTGNSENNKVDDGEENLLWRGPQLALVHEQPEHSRQTVWLS